MAKINFGAITNDARGKIRGNVFSKNKSGAYIRGKVTPNNPNTVPQSFVRNNFSVLSRNWSGLLTDSDRAAWIAYAQTYPRLDIFGASINISGLNMYLSLNQRLLQVGEPIIATPPASNVVAPIAFDPASLVANATGPVITFNQTAAAPGASSEFYLFGTRLNPPGRTLQKNDFRYIGTMPGAAGPYPATIDLFGDWHALFGPVVAGMRIAFLVSTIDTDTGLITAGTQLEKIVT